MRKIILIVILMARLSSCTTIEKCRKQYPCPEEVKTETKVVENLRDSLIYIPDDTAVLRVHIGCDSLINAYIKSAESVPGTKARINAQMKYNVLTTTYEVDSGQVYLKWKERHEQRIEVKTQIVL